MSFEVECILVVICFEYVIYNWPKDTYIAIFYSLLQRGWTTLIMAAKGGYTDLVEYLLHRDPNVNATDQVLLSIIIALIPILPQAFKDLTVKTMKHIFSVIAITATR